MVKGTVNDFLNELDNVFLLFHILNFETQVNVGSRYKFAAGVTTVSHEHDIFGSISEAGDRIFVNAANNTVQTFCTQDGLDLNRQAGHIGPDPVEFVIPLGLQFVGNRHGGSDIIFMSCHRNFDRLTVEAGQPLLQDFIQATDFDHNFTAGDNVVILFLTFLLLAEERQGHRHHYAFLRFQDHRGRRSRDRSDEDQSAAAQQASELAGQRGQ